MHKVLTILVTIVSAGVTAGDELRVRVEAEEVVTSYVPADNGAGPLWCYGSSIVARFGDDVYASVIETGEDVPPLCNTRWQLWRRDRRGWKLFAHEEKYRQREPCPLAVVPDDAVFLSVNPSTQPPGTKYGHCRPLVLAFDPLRPDSPPIAQEPEFADGHTFTDHSYRGFAADGRRGELLLLNIDAPTGAYYVSFRDSAGAWHSMPETIRFPIRSCYPQVHLRDRAAHVLAIGDIVEPNEAWRKLKFEKLQRKWDYVFRRLFYTSTPDVRSTAFTDPIEVDSVEKTGGHITNLDLYADAAGRVHLLYLKRPHQYAFIRDKYFPGQPMTVSLEYVTIKDNKVGDRVSLDRALSSAEAFTPSYARFHVGPEDTLYVVAAGTCDDGKGFGNCIARITPDTRRSVFQRIDMKHPFRQFFLSTPRAGARPSNIIDIFGIADDNPNLRYARLNIISGRIEE